MFTISIHAPREGGDFFSVHIRVAELWISIHAPREGGDSKSKAPNVYNADFNPRPPRGGRPQPQNANRNRMIFQSTPPARGATSCA